MNSSHKSTSITHIMPTQFYRSIKTISIFLLTVLSISSIQWTLVQIYSTLCAPWGVFGLIQNVLSLGSPACQLINHLQVALADHYIVVWATAVIAAIAFIRS